MLLGSLLGLGGARRETIVGFGARFLAGEKCCCRVLKTGLFKSGFWSLSFGGRREGALERELMEAELRVWPRPDGAEELDVAFDCARVVRVVADRVRPVVEDMLSLSRTVFDLVRPADGMLSLSLVVARVEIL